MTNRARIVKDGLPLIDPFAHAFSNNEISTDTSLLTMMIVLTVLLYMSWRNGRDALSYARKRENEGNDAMLFDL
jgi:hypothetical protein